MASASAAATRPPRMHSTTTKSADGTTASSTRISLTSLALISCVDGGIIASSVYMSKTTHTAGHRTIRVATSSACVRQLGRSTCASAPSTSFQTRSAPATSAAPCCWSAFAGSEMALEPAPDSACSPALPSGPGTNSVRSLPPLETVASDSVRFGTTPAAGLVPPLRRRSARMRSRLWPSVPPRMMLDNPTRGPPSVNAADDSQRSPPSEVYSSFFSGAHIAIPKPTKRESTLVLATPASRRRTPWCHETPASPSESSTCGYAVAKNVRIHPVV
mmetsp:Transcript_15210/g.45219  ORF Transcript_15210/g.45219 Transcript_15210/m.45219 type:complete len:274 (+) Transcript_15210:77-898(+)